MLESRKNHLNLITGLSMKGNGSMTSGTARGNKFGQMVQFMKVRGKQIKLVERENSYIRMEMCMRENGIMI